MDDDLSVRERGLMQELSLINFERKRRRDVAAKKRGNKPIKSCQSGRDGDCIHKLCPQLRDDEPFKTGRNCPLDS